MAFRQVKDEDRRLMREAMATARRHPKILTQYDAELSRVFGSFCAWTRLDTQDALRLLSEADSLIREEIPEQVITAYLRLDWSVFPARAASVLWALLYMQQTDGLRLIVPVREIAKRASVAELHGWTMPTKPMSPSVVMEQFQLLKRMGILDEVIPGDSGKPTEWDGYYRSRKATTVALARHPEQPRQRVRGHVRPVLWSVSLGSHHLLSTDITPITTRTPSKSKSTVEQVQVNSHGEAVCSVDLDPGSVMSLDDIRRFRA
jgi:hypothetical protein